jgi:hypothetical protein
MVRIKPAGDGINAPAGDPTYSVEQVKTDSRIASMNNNDPTKPSSAFDANGKPTPPANPQDMVATKFDQAGNRVPKGPDAANNPWQNYPGLKAIWEGAVGRLGHHAGVPEPAATGGAQGGGQAQGGSAQGAPQGGAPQGGQSGAPPTNTAPPTSSAPPTTPPTTPPPTSPPPPPSNNNP